MEKHPGRQLHQKAISKTLHGEPIPSDSIIWNGLLKARNLAKSKAKWKVGNGEDILFWQDNWLIHGPLTNNPNYERWTKHCIDQYGLKVSDYRTN
jgi:hypothetical protein